MKTALVISDRDNVATALVPLEAGARLELGGRAVVTIEAIASGHKLALVPIGTGDAVIKYGSPIGVAIADIAAGAHVHTHNVASSRGRGDLPAAAPSTARLAEPPDDPGGRPAGTSGVPPTLAAGAADSKAGGS
jgi:altronate hydrolase